MKDYYQILGVSRQADDSEIKKAFRKLAMQYHPDRGGDQARFQEINEAYNVLGDPKKRSEYDNPVQRIHVHSHRTPFNFDDIFSMFGTQFRPDMQRTASARMQLWISLRDVAQGGRRVISVASPQGQSNVEIEIPPGIDDGDTVRYPKMAPGGYDLIITFRIRPESGWERDSCHVITDKSVDFWDLILGGDVMIDTLDDRQINLRIPPRTNPGTTMRIRGHGLPRKNSVEQRGDLLVRIQAQLPARIDNDVLEAIRRSRGQ